MDIHISEWKFVPVMNITGTNYALNVNVFSIMDFQQIKEIFPKY